MVRITPDEVHIQDPFGVSFDWIKGTRERESGDYQPLEGWAHTLQSPMSRVSLLRGVNHILNLIEKHQVYRVFSSRLRLSLFPPSNPGENEGDSKFT